MALQLIRIGPANGGQGDSPFIFTAKINANFIELYYRLAAIEDAEALYQPLDERLTALSEGSIDGVVIGGLTPAAGAFTAVTTASLILGGTVISGIGTGAGTLAAGNDSRISGAAQNASAAITGGTIDGTVIGGITRAAGSFTALVANSLTGLATPLAPGQGGTGATTLTGALDNAFSSTQGAILYRGPAAWVALAPGAAGQVLTAGGAGANPAWSSASGGYTPASGAVINSARGQTAAVATTTAQTPINDAVPTTGNTAAISGLSATITPKATTNKLRVRAVVQGSMSTIGAFVAAIFRDGGGSAVAANYSTIAGNGYTSEVTVTYETTAGSTSPTTFAVGVGCNNSATLTINGIGGGRLFGGSTYSSIEVTEALA